MRKQAIIKRRNEDKCWIWKQPWKMIKRTKKKVYVKHRCSQLLADTTRTRFSSKQWIVKTFMRWWEFLKEHSLAHNITAKKKNEKNFSRKMFSRFSRITSRFHIECHVIFKWKLFLMKIFSVPCKRFEDEVHQFIYIMVLRVSSDPFCVLPVQVYTRVLYAGSKQKLLLIL